MCIFRQCVHWVLFVLSPACISKCAGWAVAGWSECCWSTKNKLSEVHVSIHGTEFFCFRGAFLKATFLLSKTLIYSILFKDLVNLNMYEQPLESAWSCVSCVKYCFLHFILNIKLSFGFYSSHFPHFFPPLLLSPLVTVPRARLSLISYGRDNNGHVMQLWH